MRCDMMFIRLGLGTGQEGGSNVPQGHGQAGLQGWVSGVVRSSSIRIVT